MQLENDIILRRLMHPRVHLNRNPHPSWFFMTNLDKALRRVHILKATFLFRCFDCFSLVFGVEMDVLLPIFDNKAVGEGVISTGNWIYLVGNNFFISSACESTVKSVIPQLKEPHLLRCFLSHSTRWWLPREHSGSTQHRLTVDRHSKVVLAYNHEVLAHRDLGLLCLELTLLHHVWRVAWGTLVLWEEFDLIWLD